jgi:hypothetical protein
MFTNQDIKRMVLHRLGKEPELSGFSTKTNAFSLKKTDNLGWFQIILEGYTSVDIQRDSELSLYLQPIISRRFDILHSCEGLFPSLPKPRIPRPTMIWKNDMNGNYINYSIDFLRSGDGFDEDYQRIRTIICDTAGYFFESLSSLESMYWVYVHPTINNGINFWKINWRGLSFSLVAEWLILTKIVDPASYQSIVLFIENELNSCRVQGDLLFDNFLLIDYPKIVKYIDDYTFKM